MPRRRRTVSLDKLVAARELEEDEVARRGRYEGILVSVAPELADPRRETGCLRAAALVLVPQSFDLCVAAADVVGKSLGLVAQAVGGLAELAELVVTRAHPPGEPDDLCTPAIQIDGERRELALSLDETLLGSLEHGPLLVDLTAHRLRETLQLLVPPFELGVACAHPLNKAGHLSTAPIPVGGESGELLLPLGETLLGSGEHGLQLVDLTAGRLIETPQLLVAPLKLGVACAHPLNKAGDLSTAPIPIDGERRELALPLGETLLGGWRAQPRSSST